MNKLSRLWIMVILIIIAGSMLACSFTAVNNVDKAEPTPDILATVQAIQAPPTPFSDGTDTETSDLLLVTVQEGEGLKAAIERGCDCSMDDFIQFGMIWSHNGTDYYVRSSYSRVFENPDVKIALPYVWPGDTIRLDESWALEHYVAANTASLNLVSIVYQWEGGERITLVGGEFAPQTMYMKTINLGWIACDVYSNCYPYLEFNTLMESGLTATQAFDQLNP